MIWLFFAVGIVALLVFFKVYLSRPVIYKDIPVREVAQYLDSLDVQCEEGSFLNVDLQPNQKEIIQIAKIPDGFCFIASDASWNARRLSDLKLRFSEFGHVRENSDASIHHLYCNVNTIDKAKQAISSILDGLKASNVSRLYIDGTLKKIGAEEIVDELTKRGFKSNRRS